MKLFFHLLFWFNEVYIINFLNLIINFLKFIMYSFLQFAKSILIYFNFWYLEREIIFILLVTGLNKKPNFYLLISF